MSSTPAFPAISRRSQPAPAPVAARAPAELHSPRWLFAFVWIEIGCQLALLVDSISILRVFVRTAAFLGSIALLIVLRRSRANHPSSLAAMASIAIVAFEIAHPNTNNLTSGAASVILNLAIVGPIFWVPRIRIDVATVRKLFLLFWAFSTLSAIFGILQIYFPGRFDPAIATVLTADEKYVRALHITLASGEHVLRPMGLTDTPGGAGIGAAYCVLFAIGFLMDKPSPLFRAVLLASLGGACFVLYICQVRSLLVMAIIGLLAMALPFALQRRIGRYLSMATVVLSIAFVGFLVAVSVGGKAVTGRLSTLIDEDVSTVYYTSRGGFLSDTVSNLAPQYPLGAGLGRWGMVYSYFADRYNTASRPLWAEIQWTGWLYDGGIVLMLVYALALFTALRTVVRTSAKTDDTAGRDLYKWATVLVGYGFGTVALTFNTAPFSGTMGVDFWVLNAAVYAASRQALP